MRYKYFKHPSLAAISVQTQGSINFPTLLEQYLLVFERGRWNEEQEEAVDDEEETVLLSFSLSDIRDCETGGGRVSSGISGSSGISKETAARNKVKKNQINESCVK